MIDRWLFSVHVCSFDNFNILDYESHKFKRLVKEPLFVVKHQQPLLNKQVKSPELELF